MKLKTREDHQQIGELSRSLGVTTRTLRLYEQMGLITPPQRTEGGIRYYTKDDIRRIKFVLKLKELGLSLQQMQELAEMYRETKMPDKIMPRLIELLDSHTDAIRRKIERLSSLARDIAEYRKRIVHLLYPAQHSAIASNGDDEFRTAFSHIGYGRALLL